MRVSRNEGIPQNPMRFEGASMVCQVCHSANTRDYTAEINIHFPGRKGLNIPTVWVFPRLSVCLECGFTQFTIPDAELETLAARDYRGWADEAAG